MRNPRRILILGSLAVAVLVVTAGYFLLSRPSAARAGPSGACGAAGGPSLGSTNLSSALPGSFSTGAIQSFGSNDSTVIFGGVSYYDRNHDPFDSAPALSSYAPALGKDVDLTDSAAPYFDEGGVFPVGWNGSAWLVAGQTTIGNVTEGSAISLQAGRFTNLTPLVAPYFQQQGIWIAGWDGEGWLLGGNNSLGAVLVYLQGDTVTNLTSLLPNNGPADWIQALAWNGSGWLVGGQGIFGALHEGRFTNLLPESPFLTGAALAMGWNGSAWLVGGSPADLVYVQGGSEQPGPSLGVGSPSWVNSVVSLPDGGWLVSGGSEGAGQYAPLLAALPTGSPEGAAVDESACLPMSFHGGWIQYGTWAPAFGANELLLVGEGGTDPVTFESHAAAAVISVQE
jgi:hypothetical protein